MKKIVFLIVVSTCAAAAWYFRQEIGVAVARHLWQLVVVTALAGLLIVLQAKNFLLLLSQDVRPNLVAAVRIWALSNIANYLGPFQPGLLVRIGFLKKYGISVRDSGSTTLRQLQLSVWVGMGLASAALLFVPSSYARVVAVAIGAGFILWPVVLKTLERRPPPAFLSSRLGDETLTAAGHFLLLPPVANLLYFVAQYAIVALCLLIVYRGFGSDLAAHEAVLVAVMSTLSGLLSIAPNNLGVQELLYGYVAYLGGLSAGDAAGIAVIFRIAHVASCMLLLLITVSVEP